MGIIGGVFVFWYAIIHWIGKCYNKQAIRGQLAESIYDENVNNECALTKMIANSPMPTSFFPKCCGIRSTIGRMRHVDKKISNDLHYLWLAKTTDNIFNMSTALFETPEERRLSMVFLKDKID